MKTETHEQCTVCFEVLDATDPTTITADILDQLQLLITKLNIKLIRNSPICDACLAKVKSACKFKTSYLDLQETFHDIKLEEDAYSEKPAVCEICKSIVSPSDTIPLFDPVTKINKLMLINHLSPELESKVNEDPQTCESCHKSMLNFCSITNLLSVFDQDIGDDSEMPSTTVKKEHLDIDSSLVSASSSKDISTIVKKEESPSEDEETEDKDCTEYEEFLTKNEELDLKMDCDEEQGDERTPTDLKQETEKRYNCSTTRNSIWNESGARDTVMEPTTNKEHTIVKLNIEERKLKNNFHNNSDQKDVFEWKSNVNMFQCETCDFKTRHQQSIDRHLLTHQISEEIEMFQCEMCEYKTREKRNLKAHILIHKSTDEVKMFQCTICEYTSKYKRCITKHMLRHKKPDEIEMFKCELCEYTTKYKSSLNSHMIRHKKPDEVELFQCDICEFKTIYKRSINNHLLIHKKPEEIKMFECELCEYRAKQKGYLKTHIMLRHMQPEEIEMFECELCEYKSRQKGYLKIHMLRHMQPEEIEIFKCELCEYKATQKKNLNKHMLRHKKIDMFQCELCEFIARQKGNLTTHMLIHKKPDEIERFECELCEFKAIQKGNLKAHMLIHKKYDEVEMFECSICQFKTKQKSYLKVHMLRHKKPDEVEMFQCAICQHKTKRKSNLNRHILSHKKLVVIESP